VPAKIPFTEGLIVAFRIRPCPLVIVRLETPGEFLRTVDFCGRTSTKVDTKVRARLVGDLQVELVHDFFDGFSRGARRKPRQCRFKEYGIPTEYRKWFRDTTQGGNAYQCKKGYEF
jgi:hypothetical protein